DVFWDGMQTGISFILTEMPPVREGTTRADDLREGRRPYLVHVRAENLIGWKSEMIGGKETLMQIRIAEVVSEPDPEHPYEERCDQQIRVIERNDWRTYRQSKE